MQNKPGILQFLVGIKTKLSLSRTVFVSIPPRNCSTFFVNKYLSRGLGTLVLWISRSMLDLNRWQSTEPIRSQRILCLTNERTEIPQIIRNLQEEDKYEINVSWQTLFIVNCFVKEKESK